MSKSILNKHSVLAAAFCAFIGAALFAFFIVPDKEFSDTEKRSLEEFPKFSFSYVADGKFEDKLESYMQDQFPLRNIFVGIGSYFDAAMLRNGIDGVYHGKDGYLLDEPACYDRKNLASNLNKLNGFVQSTGLKSYLMIVPSAGYIMKDKLPVAHKQYLDGEIISASCAMTSGNFESIKLTSAFTGLSSENQLYYKTDHHWTSRGAYEAYKAFMADVGRVPLRETDFDVRKVDGFYGTTYSKAALWLKNADTMEFWQCKNCDFTVEITDTGKEPNISDSLFYDEHISNYDMYPAYLNGNHGLTVITNSSAPGGSLLILKDSYANTLATLLAGSYSKIVMVDLRYYRTEAVSDLIAEHGIDSMLAVYGVDDIVNDTNFTWLR